MVQSSASEPSVETFTSSDGYPWRYRRYSPAGSSKAALVCLHGIQSHGGWYDYSCRQLRDADYEVFFLDRRGSGMNSAARGDAPSYGRLLDDLVEFLDSPSIAHGTRPVFLQAVSWGGKLALALQKWRPGAIDGLVLLCPGLFPRVGVSLGMRLRILATRLIAPRRLFPIPLSDVTLFTANRQWLEFLRVDPLALHHATARFLVESARLDVYLRSVAHHVCVPTLLLLAGRDRVIRNDRTQQFFQRLAAVDKNVITYAEAEHTLEFEPNPHWFTAEIVRWLDRQCQKQTARASP
jgi:alpha-beta hydrolase superfamily lysophospholipase